jgi:hypothetical protein
MGYEKNQGKSQSHVKIISHYFAEREKLLEQNQGLADTLPPNLVKIDRKSAEVRLGGRAAPLFRQSEKRLCAASSA